MKKPYIARDTKLPLVAFGHQIAEDGSILHKYVSHKAPRLMDYSDFKLLCEIGYKGCLDRQYFGVIDRVDRTRESAMAVDGTPWAECDEMERLKRMLQVAGVTIVYEDQLPDSVDYDAWFSRSCVWEGVRVGPSM